MMSWKKRGGGGFTLAELLIVVAIIAVLTAIAIPVFTSQLEKSREATDFANVRSAYAELMVSANTDNLNSPLKQADGTFEITVSPLKQKVDGWTTKIDTMEIGGIPSDKWSGSPVADGSCKVTFDPVTDKVGIIWSGEAATSGGGSEGGTSGSGTSGTGGTSGTNSGTGDSNAPPDDLSAAYSVNQGQFIVRIHPDTGQRQPYFQRSEVSGGVFRNGEIYILNDGKQTQYYKAGTDSWFLWNSETQTWDQYNSP